MPRAKFRLRVFRAANQWRWRCYRPTTGWVCHTDHGPLYSDTLTRALAHLATHYTRRAR